MENDMALCNRCEEKDKEIARLKKEALLVRPESAGSVTPCEQCDSPDRFCAECSRPDWVMFTKKPNDNHDLRETKEN